MYSQQNHLRQSRYSTMCAVSCVLVLNTSHCEYARFQSFRGLIVCIACIFWDTLPPPDSLKHVSGMFTCWIQWLSNTQYRNGRRKAPIPQLGQLSQADAGNHSAHKSCLPFAYKVFKYSMHPKQERSTSSHLISHWVLGPGWAVASNHFQERAEKEYS